MNGPLSPDASPTPPFDILGGADQRLALVLASPHSGDDYPPDFIAASRLAAHALRRSEDCFVDAIFARCCELGVPLLRARYARAYLDVNREPFELDPAMFDEPLPAFVNTGSPRVQVGLGTIARIVASGEEIYAGKLHFADALRRIEQLYRPYHRALHQLVETTRSRFGYYLLLDCHSMPSSSSPSERGGRSRVDFVLGDCHGTACDPEIVVAAHRFIVGKGYSVARNAPYAGGFTTCHYGRPQEGAHALQIEINRSLYMDERSFSPKPAMSELAADMQDLVAMLGKLAEELLPPVTARAAE